jgi:hypothetical protein
MIIGRFDKQPNEVLDYYTDLTPWLPSGDFATSATTTADAGIVVDSTAIANGGKGIRVWLSGGTTGTKYKIQVRFTTDQSRVKEFEFILRCREV